MSFPSPIAFHVGSWPIRWYGVAYASSFFLCLWYAKYWTKHNSLWTKELPSSVIDRLFTFMVLGVVLGGRIGYSLIYEFFDTLQNPLNLFMTWKGGMSFHGGLMGVIIGVLLFHYYHRVRIVTILDLMATVIPIGLFLGRLANFVNQEHPGRPTDFFLNIVFPLVDELPRHIVQIYEACLEGLVLFTILFFTCRHFFQGFQAAFFLVFYGVVRFFLEYIREPDGIISLFNITLTTGQILSIPMILIGGFWIIKKKAVSVN